MRIVYLLTSLGMGGAERLVVSLAEAMEARGHTAALLVLRPRLAEEWPTRLTVIYLGMRKSPFSVLSSIVRAHRFHRFFQPDLLHSHSFHANLVARVLTLLSSQRKLLCTIHNVYEGGWMRMMAYRLTNGLSQCTTVVSAEAAHRFLRWKAVSQEKCRVITNGISSSEFLPQEERRICLRKQMGLNDEFLWITAGRIVPAKDYPNLLSALAQLEKVSSGLQLWIAGAGEDRELESLRYFAAKLGLTDRVRWLGLRRDLPALLDAADGFVLASAWEGMPLALGEAMAMAKPVVATDVGGVREMVGETGRIVPAKDPKALAQAMRETMQSPLEERHAQGLMAQDRIAKKFSMKAKVEEWERLYKTLVSCA
jgi:glycosyltransferase involved in cell wall biosynthesis